MDIAIMIEGQNGLDWPRWKRVVAEVEQLGFAGLYRSDHFTNPKPPELDSLELWLSLTWLADHTERLRFGSVVSPVTFRHPAMTARMALQVDQLSGGRLSLGLGAGWQEREHGMFGLDLLDLKSRSDRFEEAVEIVAHLVRSDTPLTFDGRFYRLYEAVVKPRPTWSGRPDGTTSTMPILIGGNGEKRTLPLCARFADEWNGVLIPPERFQALSAHLDALLDAQGRPRKSVRRSVMQGIIFGRTRAEYEAGLALRDHWHSRATHDERRARGEIIGIGDEVVPQLAAFEEAGVQCIMLQWLPIDDMDGLRDFARVVHRWLR